MQLLILGCLESFLLDLLVRELLPLLQLALLRLDALVALPEEGLDAGLLLSQLVQRHDLAFAPGFRDGNLFRDSHLGCKAHLLPILGLLCLPQDQMVVCCRLAGARPHFVIMHQIDLCVLYYFLPSTPAFLSLFIG